MTTDISYRDIDIKHKCSNTHVKAYFLSSKENKAIMSIG